MKKIPTGAIPCCDPDPVTGHWPHWVEVDPDSKADCWLWAAFKNADTAHFGDGTYEAIGPHFQGNPYKLEADTLEKHGVRTIDANSGIERSFEGIREYLRTNPIEGIVFWRDGEPQCKILRSFAEHFLEALRECARVLSEFFGKIKACFAKADNIQRISRRTWRRPRNEYAKPLLADKRSRVFHCRNAC